MLGIACDVEFNGIDADVYDFVFGTGSALTSTAVSYGVDRYNASRNPQQGRHYTNEELDAIMAKTLPSRVQKNLKMCLN